MTKDEFEKGYAKRSGITVERLGELGLFALPCDCGEDGCKGWRTSTKVIEDTREELGLT